MARFAVTAVFEVGPGKVPRGADVLERMRISDTATHRFSYCDGRTLTALIDWTAPTPERARADAVTGVRLVWTQLTGNDPGAPLSVRIRRLTPLERVSAGVGSVRGRFRHPEGLPPDIEILQQHWLGIRPDGFEDPDDGDGGGLAGVREPRRPKPGPGHLFAALEEPTRLI